MDTMAVTIDKAGRITAGIDLSEDGRTIAVGEAGRGRRLVRVPLPAGAFVEGRTLLAAPIQAEGALLVLIKDQSGFRGSWRLRGAHSPERWQRVIAARRSHAARADGHRVPGIGAGVFSPVDDGGCPGCHAGLEAGDLVDRTIPVGSRVLAEGRCAQGDAGRMGGGPEYLLVLPAGAAVEIIRFGRLYGAPAVSRVENRDGVPTVTNPVQEAEAALAAAAW